jgi:hypothetical protein
MTHSLAALIITITTLCHYDKYCDATCRILFIVMQNVIMLNVMDSLT